MTTDREKALAAMHHAIEKHGATIVMKPIERAPRFNSHGKLMAFGELVGHRYWLERVPDACEVALTLGGWKRITGRSWTWVDRE